MVAAGPDVYVELVAPGMAVNVELPGAARTTDRSTVGWKSPSL